MAKAKSKATKNITVSPAKKEQPQEKEQSVHEANQQIFDRKYVFPLLAKDTGKVIPKRNYPDSIHTAIESEWKNFRSHTDFSVPVKVTVTKIIRIRTMSNKEQKLDEYIYYLANLQGFKKSYVEGELRTFPDPEATASDIPFGMDRRITLQPTYKNGELSGYEDKGEYVYYTEKFTKSSIDEILKNHTPVEGGRLEYILSDTGINYGGFTKEELEGCKLNRLVYRNNNKLNGTEIKDEDKIK